MKVEFEGVNWSNKGWILTDNKIIVRKMFGKNQEYLISDIEQVFHNPNYLKLTFPHISFMYNGKMVFLFYLKDKNTLLQGLEAFKYIEKLVNEKNKKLKEEKREKEKTNFEKKIAQYKKKKTKKVDKDLDKLNEKYGFYIKNYLSNLSKDGLYIISGATMDEIIKSNDELKSFYEEYPKKFELLIKYLCDNKVLIKKENSLGQIKYSLGVSIEKEVLLENQNLEIKVFGAMLKKEKEYIKGCNDDETLIKLFDKFKNSYNDYARSILNTPLHTKKPMSSLSAGIIGTAIGGGTLGALASIEAKNKLEKHLENERNCIASSIATENCRDQTEYYFYKIQTIIYEYEDVYDDWLDIKNHIIETEE